MFRKYKTWIFEYDWLRLHLKCMWDGRTINLRPSRYQRRWPELEKYLGTFGRRIYIWWKRILGMIKRIWNHKLFLPLQINYAWKRLEVYYNCPSIVEERNLKLRNHTINLGPTSNQQIREVHFATLHLKHTYSSHYPSPSNRSTNIEQQKKTLEEITTIWRILTSIISKPVILVWYPKVEETLRPLDPWTVRKHWQKVS